MTPEQKAKTDLLCEECKGLGVVMPTPNWETFLCPKCKIVFSVETRLDYLFEQIRMAVIRSESETNLFQSDDRENLRQMKIDFPLRIREIMSESIEEIRKGYEGRIENLNALIRNYNRSGKRLT